MKNIPQSLALSLIAFLLVSTPLIAQTSSISDIPKPETGKVQSDYAKDVQAGELAAANDKQAREYQAGINQNENDEGQQENDNLHLDEKIDQDEAQGEQGDEQGDKLEPTDANKPSDAESDTNSNNQ